MVCWAEHMFLPTRGKTNQRERERESADQMERIYKRERERERETRNVRVESSRVTN